MVEETEEAVPSGFFMECVQGFLGWKQLKMLCKCKLASYSNAPVFIILVNKRLFSSSLGKGQWVFKEPYEATYKNLAISKNTKVICQGFTGKQVM